MKEKMATANKMIRPYRRFCRFVANFSKKKRWGGGGGIKTLITSGLYLKGTTLAHLSTSIHITKGALRAGLL